MSTATRVLVVAITVMSFVYLGISAALFAYRVDYKNMYLTEQEAHKKTTTEKNKVIEEQDARIKTLDKNIDELQKDISVRKAELAAAKEDLVEWKDKHTQLMNNLTELNTNVEKLQASLKEQITKNQELNVSVEKMRASTEDAVKERTVLEEKYLNAQDSIIRLEKNLSTLEKQYLAQAKEFNQTKIKLDQYIKAFPSLSTDVVSAKLIEGKVVAISEKADLNIVMINVGKNDGVEVGMKFTVYRGDKYVAKIQIDKVEAQWSSAFSIKEFQSDNIRVNDNITTSPY